MYKQGISLEPGVIRDLLAHCEAYTITRLFIDSGTLNSFHSHSNSQAIFIMSGKGVFRTGAEYEEVISGECLQIQPNVLHGFCEVSERVQMLEFFTPGRPDIASAHRANDSERPGNTDKERTE